MLYMNSIISSVTRLHDFINNKLNRKIDIEPKAEEVK